MITDDEKEQLHFALAVGYIIKTIQVQGLEHVMKEIDHAYEIPEYRLYVRSLVQTALEIMRKENIQV